jgi:hypothetical protein
MSYLHLEARRLLKVFFQKLTQLSQGNNALDVPSSNMDGFNYRDMCISST